ncbi:MAG TPA: hypothetical protein PLX29_07485, partial [Anaerolineaceae bacterium]|nr:hypothetical protein [Anaerolineaceae bacterium]
ARMKISIWDILTVVLLLTALVLLVVVMVIFIHPDSRINPFPFPSLPATIVIPTLTPTLLQMPPTWTPTPF